MDRSVEMRLRMDISAFQRGTRAAAGDLDGLTARAAALDAALDRVEASSQRAAAATAAARTQVRGMGRDMDRAAGQIMQAQTRLNAWNRTARDTPRDITLIRRTVNQTTSDMSRSSGAMGNFNRQVDQSGATIDRLSGRVGIAVDGLLTLAPALVPIGALAGQAAGGLATLGIAAAVTGGSMVVAFQGIGDAAKAIQEYQDAPTADNLKAAREELDKLSPAARRFVMEFQKIRPLFDGLQEATADAAFPGLTRALEDFDVLVPKLEKIMTQSAAMGGDLAAQATESLTSERWAPFLDFIADEVPGAMASLTRIMGDLAHGAAEMWMSFDPGNDSFIDWLEGVADGFDKWASSAEGTESIADFLEYARVNGPAVGELFSSLVGALASIVQAAAPLGGPVLAGLTAVADMVKVIADSDMATPILLAAAALRIFNRLQAGAVATQARFAGPGFTPMVRDPNATAFGPMTASQQAFVDQQNRQMARQAALIRRQQMMRAGVQGGAAIGMVALASSGMTEGMEAANTASMALLGTMIAPGWGTAAGLIVGGLMDIAGANDDFVAAVERGNAALESADFTTAISSLEKARSELKSLQDDARTGSVFSPGDIAMDSVEGVKSWFGDSQAESAEKDLAKLEARAQTSQEAIAGLGEAFGMTVGPLDGSARSVRELNAVLEQLQPAMDRLNVDVEDLERARAAQDAIAAGGFRGQIAEGAYGSTTPYDDLVDRLGDVTSEMDSAQAQTENYQAVLRSLSEDFGTAADKADAFREAWDALTDPALDAEEALSKQREALKAISELNAEGGFTDKNEVGRSNLAETRDYSDAVKDRVATMIQAGRAEDDIAKAVQTSREQFIQSGIAAGFSARQMKRRADEIKLTPKMIELTWQSLGYSKFDREVMDVRSDLKSLPKEVRTALRTSGGDMSRAEAKKLADQYDLTAKQRRTLFTLVDQASGRARAIGAVLDEAAKDRSSTITVTTQRNTIYSETRNGPPRQQPKKEADGGLILGPGGPRDDLIPALLSNREYVQQAAAVAHYGVGFMDMLNQRRIPRESLPGFAAGGMAGRSSSTAGWGNGPAGWGTGPGVRDEADRTAGSLKNLRKRLREAEQALQKETAQRDKAREVRDTVGASLSVGELFGNGLTGFDTAVAANTNDTRRGEAALEKLKRRGLGGKDDTGGLYQLLAASGDLQTLQEFAKLTPAQIRAREKRYASLEKAQMSLGNEAVVEEFGQTIGSMTKEIGRLRTTVDKLGDRVERGAEKGTRNGNRDRDRRTNPRR